MYVVGNELALLELLGVTGLYLSLRNSWGVSVLMSVSENGSIVP